MPIVQITFELSQPLAGPGYLTHLMRFELCCNSSRRFAISNCARNCISNEKQPREQRLRYARELIECIRIKKGGTMSVNRLDYATKMSEKKKFEEGREVNCRL